ncbi:MAG: ABC transporter permease [Parvibaculum sp.]|nr:ABC transporter permease [Parvibaculum sp.]
MTEAVFRLEAQGAILRLRAEGDWSTSQVAGIDMALRAVGTDPKGEARDVVFDLTGVTRLDTSGAFVLQRTSAALKAQGLRTRYEGLQTAHRLMLDKIAALEIFSAPRTKRRPASITVVERIGATVVLFGREGLIVLSFLGEVVSALGEVVRNPRKLRVVPLIHHMEKAGFDALPLICLLTFLIGAVIAQQGATQLKQFGADVYTVNLISIIFLREVGVLLTAIIVAGRSGSAYTAEIGSMKMREEIDAMRTLGLDPMQMLIVPRVLALVIVLPLLTFVADIMGLIGGGVVALTQLGMAPAVYIDRVRDAAWFWTFGVGILRAPFMALAIALVSCRAGLDVTGSAESVGSQTTRSVVLSIFLVIVLDAMFAMFFTAVGL